MDIIGHMCLSSGENLLEGDFCCGRFFFLMGEILYPATACLQVKGQL